MRRRECFDEVAALYDSARPAYPDALVRDLIEAAELHEGKRLLEIGCGTGQLTVPLARCGVSLVAVELGANLAAIARARLSTFDRVSICTADFDSWSLPEEPFDVVVAATAFHWLSPVTRVQRCTRALRPDGLLAIIDTHWGVGTISDRFSRESQKCYAHWDSTYDHSFVSPTLAQLPTQRSDFDPDMNLNSVRLKRYPTEREYSAEEYCDLLQTFSDVRGFDESNRLGFLKCIRALIDERFGGRIVRQDVYDLWMARAGPR